MWFYDVKKEGAVEKRTKQSKPPLKTTNLIIGVIFVVALISLAIVANVTGWSAGADKILTAILGLVAGIPVGVFFGEKGAVST